MKVGDSSVAASRPVPSLRRDLRAGPGVETVLDGTFVVVATVTSRKRGGSTERAGAAHSPLPPGRGSGADDRRQLGLELRQRVVDGLGPVQCAVRRFLDRRADVVVLDTLRAGLRG